MDLLGIDIVNVLVRNPGSETQDGVTSALILNIKGYCDRVLFFENYLLLYH